MLKINVSFGMTWKVISVTAKKNMWKSWKKGKKTKRFTVESTDLTSLPAFPPFLNKSGCKSQCIKHTAWQLIKKKKNHQCAKCYIFLDFSICVLVFNVKTDLWFFVIKKKKITIHISWAKSSYSAFCCSLFHLCCYLYI